MDGWLPAPGTSSPIPVPVLRVLVSYSVRSGLTSQHAWPLAPYGQRHRPLQQRAPIAVPRGAYSCSQLLVTAVLSFAELEWTQDISTAHAQASLAVVCFQKLYTRVFTAFCLLARIERSSRLVVSALLGCLYAQAHEKARLVSPTLGYDNSLQRQGGLPIADGRGVFKAGQNYWQSRWYVQHSRLHLPATSWHARFLAWCTHFCERPLCIDDIYPNMYYGTPGAKRASWQPLLPLAYGLMPITQSCKPALLNVCAEAHALVTSEALLFTHLCACSQAIPPCRALPVALAIALSRCSESTTTKSSSSM